MGKILVSGLVNLEMSVPVNSFPVDYSPITYLFNGISTAVSGVGYNVFCALESLGDSVRPCSVTGSDLAALVIARAFMEKKAETDFLFPVLDKTCTSCVLFDDQGRRRIFCDLSRVQEITLPENAFGSLVSGIEGVVLCNTNFNRGLLNYLCKKDLPVFTDVHVLSDVHDSYNSPFMKRADVLFLSHENVPGNHEDFLIRLYHEYRRGKKGNLHNGKCSPKTPCKHSWGRGCPFFFLCTFLSGELPSFRCTEICGNLCRLENRGVRGQQGFLYRGRAFQAC